MSTRVKLVSKILVNLLINEGSSEKLQPVQRFVQSNTDILAMSNAEMIL